MVGIRRKAFDAYNFVFTLLLLLLLSTKGNSLLYYDIF